MKTFASLAVSLALALAAFAHAQDHSAGKKPLRVLLTFGGHEFQEKEFFAMWDSLPGVTYTKAPLPQSAGLLKPGLEKDYDAIVCYDMNHAITPEQQQAFLALLDRGIGVVMLHHNLASNPDWAAYRDIQGGRWLGAKTEIDGKSYGPSTYSHDEELPIRIADKDHPITKGLSDFVIHDESYGEFYVSPKVHVLLTSHHPKDTGPFAWTNEHGKSRIVYFQAGHDAKAWACPSYQEILVRSIRWTARGE
ncbi:ThuA domain-containing protein [Aquisphaera insulae]|uniref:ThuA domain-containing protein n=1 Tax=Aquisphaera insulae TaxID=2712864 RepID=UPI0013EA60C2|nr:ThuA domain-containing protein [Aquisphaera insulae]